MTEFIEDGVNGFHFARGDIASLAAILRKVADDPGLAQRLSEATFYDRVPSDMALDLLAMYGAHGLGSLGAQDAELASATGEGRDPAGLDAAELGIEGPLEPWLAYNEAVVHLGEAERAHIAPFPPLALVKETSGLSRPEDFGRHGTDIIRALAAASPQPLNSYRSWLDFGIGVGRVARLFKGYRGSYVGVDVDARMVEWVRGNLPWVNALRTVPRQSLPSADARFDAVVSISVFTHMNEKDHCYYLEELHRVTRSGAILMLTVHGERALQRAASEPIVFDLLGIPPATLQDAATALTVGAGFHFTRQAGHLTSSDYDYGVTFVNRRWIDAVWTKWFDIGSYLQGAIHDFQDIVVARRR